MGAQDSDGFWRDYSVPSGPSTAWTSACIAWSLAHSPLSAERRRALERSRVAIHSHRLTGGWGYNFESEPDSDTTAWVFRLMAKLSDPCAREASKYLEPFLGESGGVRTFPDLERFGTWAHEHTDVTPNAGSALVESGSDGVLSRPASCLVSCQAARWRRLGFVLVVHGRLCSGEKPGVFELIGRNTGHCPGGLPEMATPRSDGIGFRGRAFVTQRGSSRSDGRNEMSMSCERSALIANERWQLACVVCSTGSSSIER